MMFYKTFVELLLAFVYLLHGCVDRKLMSLKLLLKNLLYLLFFVFTLSCAPNPGELSSSSSDTSGADYSLTPADGYVKYNSPTGISDGYWGESMAVGDFNGDGLNDLAGGIPNADLILDNANTGGVLIFYSTEDDQSTTRKYYDALIQAPNTNNNNFGSALESYDLNSDGFSDLIVGASGEEPSNRGAVYIFYGSSSGLSTTPSQIIGEPNAASNSGFGSSLAIADLNSDNIVELIVGSNLDDTVAANAGAVWIFQGLSSGIFTAALTTQVTLGTATGSEYFGNAVAITDYNDDDIPDIIVGAPLQDNGGTTDTGYYHVYYGTGSSTTWVNNVSTPDSSVANPLDVASDYFAYSLKAADITGDNNDDLLVGVPYSDQFGTNQGIVLIYNNIKSDTTYDQYISATSSAFTSTYTGYGINVGDINNDDQIDVLVGSPLYSNDDTYHSGRIDIYTANSTSGAVYFNSPSFIYYPTSLSSGGYNSYENYFGSAVCSGDINGDGYDDLIVGSYADDSKWSDDGAIYIYYSQPNNTFTNRPDVTLNVGGYRATSRQYGSSCVVMDYNRDGNNDLLVGAQADDIGGTNGGAVFIHFGNGTSVTTTPGESIIDPGDTYNGFGSALAVGDINNDSYADLVVGAYLDDTGGSDRGIVYVYESNNSTGIISTSSPTSFQTVTSNSDYYGSSALIMDIDGDGDNDLLIGVPYDDTQASNSGRIVVYTNAGTANTLLDTTADSYIYHPSNAANANFGSALASGLYSLTTYPDLLVGSSYDDTVFTDSGSVFIYQGSASGPSSTATQQINSLDGSNSLYEGLGSAISVFDFNQDSTNDLAIGAFLDDATGRNAGSVYVKVE